MQITIHNPNKLSTIDYRKVLPLQGDLKDLTEANAERLKKVFERRGFRQPLNLWKRGNDFYLLDGHQRQRVMNVNDMNDNGSYEVPYFLTEAKDEAEAKMQILEISSQYGTITQEGFDEFAVELPEAELPDVYFDALLFGKHEEPEVEEDEAPPVADVAISKLGEVYQLGTHRIKCGSAIDEHDINDLMNDKKASILFTSPPYNDGDTVEVARRDKKYNEFDDKQSPEQWKQLVSDSLRIGMNHSNYQFYNIQQLAGNKIAFIELLYEWRNNFVDMAIWDKVHGVPALPHSVLNAAFEYICIFTEQENPNKVIKNTEFHGTVDNIYHGNGQQNNEFADIHSATFPVHFPAHFINNFTNKNDIVLDNFLGTGTTLIACEELGRICYGIDLDPLYIDVCRKRYWKFINDGNEEGWEDGTPRIN